MSQIDPKYASTRDALFGIASLLAAVALVMGTILICTSDLSTSTKLWIFCGVSIVAALVIAFIGWCVD